MGCHYHVFIGPYLEVHNPERPTAEKIQSCTNVNCIKHKKRSSDAFCPKCGTKIEVVEISSHGRKEFNAWDEFEGERMTELRFEGMPEEYADYMLFTSNLKDTAGTTLSDDTVIMPFDTNSVQEETRHFAVTFKKEILRLEEVFGKDYVKIKWGAIGYWY